MSFPALVRESHNHLSSVAQWLEQLPRKQKISGSIPELGSFSTSEALHIATVVTWKVVDGWRGLSWYHHIIDGAVGMPKPSSGAEDSSIPHEGLVSAAFGLTLW